MLAFGPPTALQKMRVAAHQCLRWSPPDNLAEAVWCGFTLSLLPLVRLAQPELGERALVIGGGLAGYMLAQLVMLAGAATCTYVASEEMAARQGGDLPGLHCLSGAEGLDETAPSKSADLLIDLSGLQPDSDPSGQRHWRRVRDAGRVLVVGSGGSFKAVFDGYADLHKRSLKITYSRLPEQLRPDAADDLPFVRHLHQRGGLSRAAWPVQRLSSPDTESLAGCVQSQANQALLISW